MANVTIKPFYQNINGVLFPGTFKPHQIREALSYKPTPRDVFIATYPKCGTTWMQAIACFIFRNGKPLDDPKEFSKTCPFIDRWGNECVKNIPERGAFQTHLPFTHVPYSPDTKYIYVLRNPKDCCVSMYYHAKRSVGYWEATFDDFFETFMDGEVEYNDYFDHLDSWYPHINDKNVFFTTFERLKENKKDIILNLITFLGQEYVDAIQKDNNVLNNILQFTDFDYMKYNMTEVFERKPAKEDLNYQDLPEHIKVAINSEQPPDVKKIKHIRKGIVGDWRSHFSEEQSERMNKRFFERTNGTEIHEMYKDLMY